MKQSSKFLVLIAVLALSLGGCGKKPAGTADSKVAVKVNGESIGVAELDMKSGNMHAGMNGGKQHGISGPLLKMVVDTELVRQAAIQSKLDADEGVRAKIANATRMILASAYMEKRLGEVAKPTDRKSTRLNSSHSDRSRMPSSA